MRSWRSAADSAYPKCWPSGAKLVEVGTNNVFTAKILSVPLTANGLILRAHASNYRIDGFTHEPCPLELAALGQRADLRSSRISAAARSSISRSTGPSTSAPCKMRSATVCLVTFSGDKLLGGPQAGVVAGRAYWVARFRTNPLLRALRVGKPTIAALAATLRCHRDRSSREHLPIYRMLAATLHDLSERAKAYVSAVPGALAGESDAYIGGGALPRARIPSIAVAIRRERPQDLTAELRRGNPPIIARIESGRVLLDLRTVAPEEDQLVIASRIEKGAFSIGPL